MAVDRRRVWSWTTSGFHPLVRDFSDCRFILPQKSWTGDGTAGTMPGELLHGSQNLPGTAAMPDVFLLNRRLLLQLGAAGVGGLALSSTMRGQERPAEPPRDRPTRFQIACMTLPYSQYPLAPGAERHQVGRLSSTSPGDDAQGAGRSKASAGPAARRARRRRRRSSASAAATWG